VRTAGDSMVSDCDCTYTFRMKLCVLALVGTGSTNVHQLLGVPKQREGNFHMNLELFLLEPLSYIVYG
jgi:hypothetical protein